LNFSVGSVEVISISNSSSFISSTFGARFGFRGVGDISKETHSGGSDGDGVSQDKPDNIFFTRGERERSSIFVVIKGRGTVVLIVIINKFGDVEIFGQQVVSFFEEGVGQVKNIHFFEGLDDGTGSLGIKHSNDGLLFEGSFDGFVDNLEFGIEFSSHNSVFSRSMQQKFTNLIFSGIKIDKFSHVNIFMFGHES